MPDFDAIKHHFEKDRFAAAMSGKSIEKFWTRREQRNCSMLLTIAVPIAESNFVVPLWRMKSIPREAS
jgi:hypothetical protein